MFVPIIYNFRSLLERKATTLMTAVGIALTVAVLMTSIALTHGLIAVFAGSGHPLHLLVLRKGTDAELTSQITADTYQIVRQLPGIALSPNTHEPLVSPEALTVVNLPSDYSPEGMNVTVRGLLPVGLEMRDLRIVKGRMFTPGLRELAVGQAVAQRYPDARIGHEIRFGKGLWKVVGVFSAGESATNSEIWVDLNQLRGDFEQSGGSSSLLVRAASPSALEDIKNNINQDQRVNTNTIEEKQYYADLVKTGAFLIVLGYFISAVMAVGSAFAATNTMYAAVARRAPEIGILRALGFTRLAILISFVMESILLALIGGILGVLITLPLDGMTTGVGNFKTFADTSFNLHVISPFAIPAGLLFSFAIGAVGGFLPAWAASRKTIVQSMRDF